MKLAVLLVSALLIISFGGCTDSNVSNPKNEKSYTLLKLPAKANLSVEDVLTASKDIDGSTGGTITLKDGYKSTTGWVDVDMTLVIPAGLFLGVQTVSVTLDGTYASFKFAPDINTRVNNPVLFTCTLKGMTGLRASDKYDFIRVDKNGNIHSVVYDAMSVDPYSGTCSVTNAHINDYDPDSRYGWATIWQ